MAICILVAFVIAIPLVFIFGTFPFKSANLNITGNQCTKVKTGTSTIGEIYSIVLASVFFILSTVLIFSYFKIGAASYKNTIKMNKCKSDHVLTYKRENYIDRADKSFIKILNRRCSIDPQTKAAHKDRDQFSRFLCQNSRECILTN